MWESKHPLPAGKIYRQLATIYMMKRLSCVWKILTHHNGPTGDDGQTDYTVFVWSPTPAMDA
jgi:hypothetical protein